METFLVKDLFRSQLRKNKLDRINELKSANVSESIIAKFEQSLYDEIKLPGEQRGYYKEYLNMVAKSGIVETVVHLSLENDKTHTTGWAVQINDTQYIVMFNNVYKHHTYLNFMIQRKANLIFKK